MLTQHIRDEYLLNCIADYFGCGQTYKDYVEFKCQSFKNIRDKILPEGPSGPTPLIKNKWGFFKKYPILGVKVLDFND